MGDLNMIWDEVISMLELNLNSIQLKNWVMPLSPVSLVDGQLILDAKSEFIRKMVSKKYLDAITEAISYICENPTAVRLIDPSMNDYYLLIGQAGADPAASALSADSDSADDRDEASAPGHAPEELITKLRQEKASIEQLRAQNGYNTLNSKYTMDSFVRGKSNDFAYATAKAVVKNPGSIYNPLFIYGLSGLGKTHLMQAIAHQILADDPAKKVLYITSEKFMNEMIAMIENGTNAEKEKFRVKYRSIDVLLIDDIQFIAGKKATMEEIFHTFNDLKEANKQIILSSDKPPKELKNLEDRLVTRFEGGMTADIQQPDFETRVAILNHKMKGESVTLPRYVLEFIASNITTNIRELEGALLKAIAYFRFKAVNFEEAPQSEVLAIARDALKIEDKREFVVTVDDIIKIVSKHYSLETGDLISKSRQSAIAFPRQVAMYIARKLTNLSLVSIGQSFDRDHTTVMHAIDKVDSMCAEKSELNEELTHLIEVIKGQ